MKLIIAIAHERNKHALTDKLLENGITFTKLGSTGGFLRQGNTTLLIGLEDELVPKALDILHDTCGATETYVNVPTASAVGTAAMADAFAAHPVKVETGGAVAFVLDVENFVKF